MKICSPEVNIVEFALHSVCASEVCFIQCCFVTLNYTFYHLGLEEVRFIQNAVNKVYPVEVRFLKICVSKIAVFKNNIAKLGDF